MFFLIVKGIINCRLILRENKVRTHYPNLELAIPAKRGKLGTNSNPASAPPLLVALEQHLSS